MTDTLRIGDFVRVIGGNRRTGIVVAVTATSVTVRTSTVRVFVAALADVVRIATGVRSS